MLLRGKQSLVTFFFSFSFHPFSWSSFLVCFRLEVNAETVHEQRRAS